MTTDEPNPTDGDSETSPDAVSAVHAKWPLSAVLSGYDEGTQTALLEWFAACLQHAHTQNRECWVVTRSWGPSLRLLVGIMVAFEIRRDRIGVGVLLSALPESVSLEGDAKPDFVFKHVQGSVFRSYSIETFLAQRENLRAATFRFIELSQRRTSHARFHAPDLLDAIAAQLSTDLPHRAKVGPRVKRAPLVPSVVAPATTSAFAGLLARLDSAGLQFPAELVASYLLALQSKRFVILSGISGTGKTQLAIEVAKAFQPAGAVGELEREEPIRSSEACRIRVQPYMLKYRRLVVPSVIVDAVVGEHDRVTVRFDGDRSASLRWAPAGTATQLLFMGEFREWFGENFELGDELELAVESEDPLVLRVSTVGPVSNDDAVPPTPPLATYAVIAVRPDWTDNRGLLGFYNPITQTYQSTPFLQLLLAASTEQARADKAGVPAQPYFVVLDEMNLARVEHYFSDFLSCLESGEPLDLHSDRRVAEGGTESGEVIPQRLKIPRNLFFTGTVNVDETTSMFSPKVLDRAFVLEFNHVDLDALAGYTSTGAAGVNSLWLHQFGGVLDTRGKPDRSDYRRLPDLLEPEYLDVLARLNERLELDHRHFGYRVANEIARFIGLAYDQTGTDPTWDALDVAILAKVLPKIHGTQQEVEPLLGRLLAFAVDIDSPLDRIGHEAAWDYVDGDLQPKAPEQQAPDLPRSAAKLWRMLRRVRQQGYVSFIE